MAHSIGDTLESVVAARLRLLDSLTPLEPEVVELDSALHRVLAETLEAAVDLPGFDNSAMDGYAVRAIDIVGARVGAPVSLAVVGESRAGAAPSELTPGVAMRIMTGAPMPAGADTVVRQEDTQRRDGQVLVEVAAARGTFVRRRGEDLTSGQEVLEAGRMLTPIEIGVAAALGRDHVLVRRRPRVGVLATGDELVAAGGSLGAAGVVDSNSPMLIAAVREAGGDPTFLGIAADSPDAVRRLLNVDGYDIIVSSAGVSVGDHDHVRDVVAELGEVTTWRIAMRPGKPMLIGRVGRTLFLGLPGNPVSASVTFELFVRPAIRRLQGATDPMRRRMSVRLGETMQKPVGLETYARAVLRRVDGALPVATSSGAQGSHMLRSLAAADCLLILPAEAAEVAEGTSVEAIPLR
ncbi:MAG TPA: gephyrin-like molybdotransferase Glp [Candidatus Dormibacteraeota bacterium]